LFKKDGEFIVNVKNGKVFDVDGGIDAENRNIEYLTILYVHNEFSILLKQLPPPGVDSCSLEVVTVTVALDFDSVVLPVVVSDSLGNLIEPELLLSDILSPSLEDHVGTTEHLNNSIEWKFRDKVEWSVDIEAKFFIKSLGFSLGCLVNIEDLPFLSFGSVVAPNLNWVSFYIFSSSNIKGLVVGPVDELVVLVLEDLEPSRVSAPDLHVVGFTS
jgi:hypothetical protein